MGGHQDLIDHNVDRNVIVHDRSSNGQTTNHTFRCAHQKALGSVLGDGPTGNRFLPSSSDFINTKCLISFNLHLKFTLTHARPNDAARKLVGILVHLMLGQVLRKSVRIRVVLQYFRRHLDQCLFRQRIGNVNHLLRILWRRVQNFIGFQQKRVDICTGHMDHRAKVLQLIGQLHNASCAKQIDVDGRLERLVKVQRGRRMEYNVDIVNEQCSVCGRKAKILFADVTFDGDQFLENALVGCFEQFFKDLLVKYWC